MHRPMINALVTATMMYNTTPQIRACMLWALMNGRSFLSAITRMMIGTIGVNTYASADHSLSSLVTSPLIDWFIMFHSPMLNGLKTKFVPAETGLTAPPAQSHGCWRVGLPEKLHIPHRLPGLQLIADDVSVISAQQLHDPAQGAHRNAPHDRGNNDQNNAFFLLAQIQLA